VAVVARVLLADLIRECIDGPLELLLVVVLLVVLVVWGLAKLAIWLTRR
jgi:hypothetical protein